MAGVTMTSRFDRIEADLTETRAILERAMGECHRDLKAGTLLRANTTGLLARLVQDMHGTMAYCQVARKDGQRDRRYRGWSGSLPKDIWIIEGEGSRGANNLQDQ